VAIAALAVAPVLVVMMVTMVIVEVMVVAVPLALTPLLPAPQLLRAQSLPVLLLFLSPRMDLLAPAPLLLGLMRAMVRAMVLQP
jgi:hypothetical protein